MKNLLMPLALVAGFVINLTAAESKALPPAREAIEWCDIWISHANKTNLPRVLLIGDSIARDPARVAKPPPTRHRDPVDDALASALR